MTRSIFDIEQDIKAKTDERRIIHREIDKLCQERAELKCPFKIGEIVVDPRGIRAIVTMIKGAENRFFVYGCIIKKNGEPGSTVKDLYCYHSMDVEST